MLRCSSNSKRLISFLVAALFGLIMLGISLQEVSAADYYAYTTNSYDVDMVLHENNTIDVTETIDVNFNTSKHGIYRYIPIKGEVYYQKDGKEDTLTAAMNIKNVKVDGYEYEVYEDNGNEVIQIGSEDYTVTGKQTYKISYTCVLYDDQIEDFDMFYYNVIPNKWETPISNTTVHIQMPKEFSDNELDVYVGNYGTSNYAKLEGNKDGGYLEGTKFGGIFSGKAYFSRNGKNIEIKVPGEMLQGAGITVQTFLPQGYFVGAKNYDYLKWVIMAIAALMAVIAFIMWLVKGRDDKVIETVEFYPPEGMSSAEIGYIVDGAADKEDIVSMIIYFADKGYLEIEETESGKDFILHKKKDLPQDAKQYERTFFYGLFPYNGSVSIKSLGSDFYPTFKATTRELQNYFTKTKSRNVFESASMLLHVVSCIMAAVPAAAGIWLGCIYSHESSYRSFIMILGILLIAALLALAGTFDKRNNMKHGKWFALMVLLGGASALLACLGALAVAILVNVMAAIVVLASTAVVAFFMLFMAKRTKYGTEMLGKILGFKNFLEAAEVERLQTLVDENPEYFYNILPYTYVLGLSDKVSKKFEKITMRPPVWYRGYYNDPFFNAWVFYSVFHHCTNMMSSHIATPPKESGGGFGGGGGFSGGGFGGGGGGSW